MRNAALLLLVLSTAGVAAAQGAAPWVAPYHPCYQWGEGAAAEVPWGSLTHLILGYLFPEQVSASEYTVVPPDWYPTWYQDAAPYVAAGHLAGRTVTCMLGGAGSNPGNVWNNATSAENVTTFAANIAAVLQAHGFDGADLDWEDNVDHAGLVRLAVALRAAWPGAVITIPTSFAGEV